MTSSVKPEVHNISQRRKRQRAQKFGEVRPRGFPVMRPDRQTDRRTNRQTNYNTSQDDCIVRSCCCRLERERLEEEQRLKAEQELEREREEAAREEAERRAREEEKRQEEWLRHQQELQDKLRQGLRFFSYFYKLQLRFSAAYDFVTDLCFHYNGQTWKTCPSGLNH